MKTHIIAILVACLSIIGKNVLGQLAGATPGGEGGGLPFKLPSVMPLGPGGEQGNQLPQVTPEQKACFQSFIDQGRQSCLQDITSSFQTQKVSLNAACCSFLNKIESSCKPVVHFQNPFFQALVKDHCAGGGGGDAIATPSTFGDQTGPGGSSTSSHAGGPSP